MTKVVVEEEPLEEPTQQIRMIDNYVPLIKDTQWIYQINGDEKDLMTVYIEYATDNVFQVRFENDYEDIIRVYTSEMEGFYEVAKLEATPQKIDYTLTRQYKKPLISRPIEKASEWQVDEDTRAKIYHKTKDFIEVSYKGDMTNQAIYVHYEEKVGPTKIEIKKASETHCLELIEVKKGLAVQELIDIYYVDRTTKELKRIIQDVGIMTNEEPKHFFTDLFKKVPNDTYYETFSADTVINKIYLDQEESRVYIDLNTAYQAVHETFEEKVFALKSLAYTVGHYYDVEYVNLSIEGEPYQTLIQVYDKETGIELIY